LRDVIYGGQRLEWRVVATREAAFRAYYDYIDHAVRSTPAASLVGARANAMRRYPESLLLSAWNRLNTARWIAEESWDGRPHDVVLFADADGALVTLYLDRGTGRLSKVEFIGDDAILGDIAIETAYDDYRETGPLTLPWRYVDRTGGYVLQDLRATSIRLDTQPADSFFTLPEEFPEVAPPPSTPQVEKLGEQVYAILGNDYNSLAVGFNDYIMVLEAGGNSSWSQAVIARVKEVIPNKPIRYLVTTHWNFDHLAGVRSYIAEGTTILATPMTKAVIERAAAATHALRPDALSRNPKPPVIELMDGSKRVFSDGTRTVEIHDISPSPHVDEMLIAYLPVEKTLFEGDLFDLAVAGRVGTGGEDTADLERKIRDLRLDVRRIVPVHGVIGTMDDLRQALARRAAAR
jgi:glyoxylase-like metal-dependent hydrolase (beta-lactamase superfamily II)